MREIREDLERNRIVVLPLLVLMEVELDQVRDFQGLASHWVPLVFLDVRDDVSRKRASIDKASLMNVHDVENHSIGGADRVLEGQKGQTATEKGKLRDRNLNVVLFSSPFVLMLSSRNEEPVLAMSFFASHSLIKFCSYFVFLTFLARNSR